MADLAQLGLEVDSSGIKDATKNLQDFNKAADDTAQRSGAIEAAAKRSGISYDEMAARIANASASTAKQNTAMDNAASSHAKFATSAHGATDELTRLSEIAAVIESRMEHMGASLGIVGEVLQVIGPTGLAVAAGLGAAVVAVDQLVSSANRMGELATKLSEVSSATGISTNSFQALGAAGAEFGLSTDRTGQFLERFTAQLQGVHDGSGALYVQLQKIDPALASEMSASKNGADALNILAKAYKSAADEAQKALIVRTAFGRGSEGAGGEFLASVADKGGVDAVTEEVNKLDLVTKEQIETWRKLGAQINESSDKAKNNIASIFTGPVLEAELNYYQNLLAISRVLKDSGISDGLNRLSGTPSSLSGDLTPINGYGGSAPGYKAPSALPAPPNFDAAFSSFEQGEKGSAATIEAVNGSIGDQIAKQKDLVSALGNAANATEKLKLKQLELQQAMEQNKFGPKDSPAAMAAAASALDQVQIDNQAAQAADRQKEAVAGIAAAWGDVTNATALQLDHLQNQLPVVEAIGAAAKMQAQEEATIADLKAKGVKANEAQLIAAKQYELSSAAAVSSAQKMVKASQDNLDLTLAAGTADEARVKSDISYRQAIEGGARASQAAAISANVMATETVRAEQAAQSTADAYQRAATAALAAAAGIQTINHNGDFGGGTVNGASGGFGVGGDVSAGKQYTSGGAPSLGYVPMVGYVSMSDYDAYQTGKLVIGPLGQLIPRPTYSTPPSSDVANLALQGGGLNSAINTVQQSPYTSDQFSTVQSLYDLKNSQTSDKSSQIANIQQEMAWLETRPETIARDQQIVGLQQSIDALNSSVVANTASNNAPGKQVIIYVQPGATADEFIKSRAQIQRAIGA